MADEKKIELAKQVYKTLCDAIDSREWTYDKDEDDLIVRFGVSGDDIPMRFIIVVDADRQLIRVLSFMPFNMCEEKRIEGALATCEATFRLTDGSFDYNIFDGSIAFRMTASFRESIIGEELFQYMISCSCVTVDRYNDQFLAIDKGILSVEDFIDKR